MAESYLNDPGTTLAAAITSTSATSLTVASSTGYSVATGQIRIKIDSELLAVTVISGTTWTVTRGIESTTAATHLIGATVNAVLSAGGLTAVLAQQTYPQKYTTTFSAATSVTVTHNLGTTAVTVTVFDNSGNVVIPQNIAATSTSVVTLTFGASFPLSGSGTVVVVG